MMQIEDDLGIEIPESVTLDSCPWEHMTVDHLVNAVHSCLDGSDKQSRAERAVISAIKTAFPSAPQTLPPDVPLLDAIAPDRDYGASYD